MLSVKKIMTIIFPLLRTNYNSCKYVFNYKCNIVAYVKEVKVNIQFQVKWNRYTEYFDE